MRMDIDEDSPANCREVRRRRVEMRRLASLPGAASAPSGSSGEGGGESQKLGEQSGCEEEGQWNRNQTDGSHSSSSSFSSWATGSGAGEELPGSSSSSRSDQAPAADQSSIYGFMSVSGRSRVMEDAVSLRPDFYRPEVVGRQKLHFFGVFDGHGGSHVSTLCRERMHELLAEEVGRVSDSSGNLAGGYGWSVAMGRCFQRMDEVALSACACGRVGSCESCGVKSDIVGSTAVVAVVGPDRMVVANCGDSRAVLCRGGRAIPLSNDHKPDRPDELARIEAAGGRVIYLNGARVLGILAMSRALGDKYLKPIVISEPEVNVTERTPDDEFLILASDGLWDVLSNDTACEVAWTCLHEGGPPSIVAEILDTGGIESTNEDEETRASRSRCSVAAALLTRLALGRKSDDNISVIVVDLSRG